MTKAENLIWNSVYHGAIKAGATEKAAKDNAVLSVNDFRRKGFSKEGAKQFVDKYIKLAKKQK
jgi:hypothetical protein